MKGAQWETPRSCWRLPNGEIVMVAAHRVEGSREYHYVKPHPDAVYLGLQREPNGLIDPTGPRRMVKGKTPLKLIQGGK